MKRHTLLSLIMVALASSIASAQTKPAEPSKEWHAEVEFAAFRQIALTAQYDWKVGSQKATFSGFGAFEATNEEWSTIHAMHVSLNKAQAVSLSTVIGTNPNGTHNSIGLRVNCTQIPRVGNAISKVASSATITHYVRLIGSEATTPNQTWVVVVPRTLEFRNVELESLILYVAHREKNYGRYEIWIGFKAIPRLGFGTEIESSSTDVTAKIGFKFTLKK